MFVVVEKLIKSLTAQRDLSRQITQIHLVRHDRWARRSTRHADMNVLNDLGKNVEVTCVVLSRAW